jgi:hypothetical protein
VTNFDAGKPIYAKVKYTQVKDVDMSNLILEPGKPGFMNGETTKTFMVVGTGKSTTIETSRFGDKYDTVTSKPVFAWVGIFLFTLRSRGSIITIDSPWY